LLQRLILIGEETFLDLKSSFKKSPLSEGARKVEGK
jgi:hypothetical protein